jgi:hypothetical protein
MKIMNKRLLLFLSFFALTVFSVNVFSQDKNSWQPMYLMVSGLNVMDGVEANFQLNTCGSENVVYIKFSNRNSYDVKLEWYDAVFTTELKWITQNGEGNKRHLVLPSKNEFKGSCADNKEAVLVVKLADFVANKENFKRFHTSELTVTPIQ